MVCYLGTHLELRNRPQKPGNLQEFWSISLRPDSLSFTTNNTTGSSLYLSWHRLSNPTCPTAQPPPRKAMHRHPSTACHHKFILAPPSCAFHKLHDHADAPLPKLRKKKRKHRATAVRRAPSIAQPGTWPKRQHAYALCQPGTQIVYHCMDQCQNDGPTRVGQSPGPEKECTVSTQSHNRTRTRH